MEVEKIVEQEMQKLNIKDPSIIKKVMKKLEKIDEKMTKYNVPMKTLPLQVQTEIVRKVIEIFLGKQKEGENALEETIDMVILGYRACLT